MSTVSCPQPCSAPVDVCLCCFYGITPSHIWSFSFPTAFYFSQRSCLFQRTLPSHDVPEVGQLPLCSFCLQLYFRLSLSRTRLFILLAVQGSHEALLHISKESCFSPLSDFLTVQCLHPYIVIGNTRVWRILALVSNDTSSFLVIFPHPSIAALLSLRLLLTSWLQSPFKLMTEAK